MFIFGQTFVLLKKLSNEDSVSFLVLDAKACRISERAVTAEWLVCLTNNSTDVEDFSE